MKRSLLPILVAACLAGSCAEPTIPRDTAAGLQNQVADIRAVVENGQVFAARQRLERLTAVVSRLMEGEKLEADTALEILSAIDAVEAALELAPERSPDPEPTSPPPPPEDVEDEGEGQGSGNGNGHGNDKDKEKGDKGHGNDED